MGDFLTNYFNSAMQAYAGSTGSPPVPQFLSALSGTDDIDANIQIFEKSSTYFVATTHAMYYLELADEALKKNNTAAAKNHFDSIAAVYFGCGDTNPVPLPIYPPDTVVTTSPQEATQILWTKDADEEDGESGTLYSIYNLANKRASNYGNCGPSKTGTCTTSKTAPQSKQTTVTVADLNILVADSLNYGVSGPTSAAVSTIRDSINTINAQAAQRYIARISLDANNPGNGMGGSTKRGVTAALPTGLGANTVPTACGGGMFVPNGAPYVADGNAAAMTLAKNAALLAQNAGGVTVAFSNIGKNVAIVPPATTAGYTTTTWINAPCGSTASATGTAASNTATMASVMNVITQQATADADPYKVQGTAANAGPAAGGTAAGGVASPADAIASTNKEVTAATRGETTYEPTSDYTKKTPTGCIGPNVFFSNVRTNILNADPTNAAARTVVYSFCDPTGFKGVARSDYTIAQNINLYNQADGALNAAGVETYSHKVFGDANHPTADITADQAALIRNVWDPIMAAQLTEGGFCCNAQYYSADGAGRAQPYFQPGGQTTAAAGDRAAVPAGTAVPTGSGLLSVFVPPLSGGDMEAAVSPGTMCPAHGSGDGKTAKVTANIGLENPAMKEMLEGRAFYAALAPSQYNIPTTSTTATTQTARAKKQRMCAEHITSMMKLNKKAASTPTGTAQTNPATAGAAASVFKYSYSAVEFPLWKVAIGASDNAVFTVPNGYCYANACLDDFAKVGTQSTFKGTEKLGELVKGPNMAVVDATTACGRANVACAAAPATWNGGPAVMNKVGCTATTCTAAGILNTTGAIPVV